MIIIKNNLKTLRESRKLRQQDIGALLDLPQGEISKLETGKRVISMEDAIKLAQFYSVSLDEIMGR